MSACEICTDHPIEYINYDGDGVCRWCAGHYEDSEETR